MSDVCRATLPAILHDSSLTFRQWQIQSAKLAASFEQGEHVGVVMPPSVDALLLLHALVLAEALVCVINPRWPRAQIERAAAACGCNRLVYSLDDVQSATERSVSPTVTDLARPAVVVFTSGSSNEPKPAVLSMGNLQSSALAANNNMPLGPGDRWLLSLPLHHVSGLGLMARCVVARACIAVPEAGATLLEGIEHFKPTHLSLVPTQLHRLLADERGVRALARTKAILMGGAPMPPRLVRRAVEVGLPLYTSYGLTETATQITATQPGDGLEALLTSGKPLTPGTVSISPQGEILVRGEALFLGYLEIGEIKRPVDDDGWFATGDLGRFDEQGRLVVEGRRDNMFISGGENVQPEEIERALCGLPGVEKALVVPVDDDEYGQVGSALVSMEDDSEPNGEALKAQLREVLPGYKIPRRFAKLPPDMAIDKVNRKDVARQLGLVDQVD